MYMSAAVAFSFVSQLTSKLSVTEFLLTISIQNQADK